MQLAVIRHLPTEWNQQGLLQGSRDIPLSPLTETQKRGITENIDIINRLEPIEQVITSSLIRTQETAKFYGYNDFIIDPLLNELNFGEFEGKKKSLLMERYKHEWVNNPKQLVLGESLADFENRIFIFLEKYKKGNNLLVFGHGSWIRALKSIREIGTIQRMNQVEVPNNQLTLLNFHFEKL
jgi:broad specificity phosphatase PhoE